MTWRGEKEIGNGFIPWFTQMKKVLAIQGL
jgi:hypothetical protein